MLTDDYAATWGSSPEDGRAECETDDYKGLQKGQYTVGKVEVKASSATVQLELKPAGERTFKLVRTGDDWRVDSMDERYEGTVGDTFPLRASYTENDVPVEEDLRFKVLAVRDPAPKPRYSTGDRGKRYVRARIKITSNGPDIGTHSIDQFQLVDTAGRRYTARADYEPSLGNNSIEIAAEDTIAGYVSFLVPKKTRLKEVRRIGVFSDDAPLIWRVTR